MRLRASAKLIASAKDIKVAPIAAWAANAFVRRVHYSGKVAANSQLHLGVFLDNTLEGAMQFGPSLDKSKLVGLVAGTSWNGFLELNRLAFTDRLPRNSESRALGIALRMIRKHYPHVQWIVSFADATQCGDGTIYRAAGFALTGIRKNTTIWAMSEDKETFSRVSLTDTRRPLRAAVMNRVTKGSAARETGSATMKPFKEMGFRPLPGYQLRYVYFLDPRARGRLTVPILPFTKIDEMGAGMYRGEMRAKQAMTGHHLAQRRGSTDPHAPHQEAT
jgi:hypothetical protein